MVRMSSMSSTKSLTKSVASLVASAVRSFNLHPRLLPDRDSDFMVGQATYNNGPSTKLLPATSNTL